MTLKNALQNFKNLVSATSKKSEKRVYQKFIQILSGLETRNLPESEIKSIERKLDELELLEVNRNNQKYFDKALKQFLKYLKDTYSFVPISYYSKLGMGLGLTIGILCGVLFLSNWERSLGIAMGLSIGMVIGLIIGQSFDARAIKQGRVI